MDILFRWNEVKRNLFVLTLILLLGLITPMHVSAISKSSTTTVRFTAVYRSGNSDTKSVYYETDHGGSHYLGTVSGSSNGDFTFSADFSHYIRVYVSIDDDAIYHSHLYINGDVVAGGDVGNGGLSYSRADWTGPSGRITSPINGTTITQCPLVISANVADDNSGVAWAVYNVYYDGVWHQIASETQDSGASGWGTVWDCSQVADQEIKLGIIVQDSAGNKVVNPNGLVTVNLAKGGTVYPTGQANQIGGQVVVVPIITATLANQPAPSETPSPIPLPSTATDLPTPIPATPVPTVVPTSVQDQSAVGDGSILFEIRTFFGNFLVVWRQP